MSWWNWCCAPHLECKFCGKELEWEDYGMFDYCRPTCPKGAKARLKQKKKEWKELKKLAKRA